MKNKIIILLAIIFSLQFALAASPNIPVIQTTYNYTNIPYIDATVYQSDSAILRITTANVTSSCSYREGYSSPILFNGEYGLTHEAYLMDLAEGFHEYYVKCDGGLEKYVGFATSIPIFATIQISKEPPLKEGIYKVNLITSKIPSGNPTLEYSFDEIVYRPMTLTGFGTNWEGNLIIPGNVEESVCSFRFSAKDLSGNTGNKIIGDSSFVIDTIVPSAIGMINAVGYEGQIRLDWFFDEGFKEFNIYKSEDPNVDYTDFFKTITKKYFYDNEVEKGQNYYYRVAAVDEAGNIAPLSKEVYATALLNNYTKATGLNPKFVGKVDNSIAEINSVIETIDSISQLIELKEEKVQTIFSDLKLDKELTNSVSELNSLKRDIESYKLQDLSEEELNNKLSSSTLKLNIIKKKIPEDLTILEEKETERVLNEQNVQKAFLEYFDNSGEDYDKEISEILKLIEENNLKITSKFYSLQILYLDGSKKEIGLFEDTLNKKLGESNINLALIIPKEIAETSSEIKFMNINYDVIKDDPVISFNSETEKIVYYLNKELESNSLEEIILSPVKDKEVKETPITGNVIFSSISKRSFGIFGLVIFALILGVYFLKIKNETSIKPALKIMENIKKSRQLIKEGKEQQAKEIYNIAKEQYKLLSDKEKRIIIEGIKAIENES